VVVVVAKVREILALGKQAAPSFDGERFNLRGRVAVVSLWVWEVTEGLRSMPS